MTQLLSRPLSRQTRKTATSKLAGNIRPELAPTLGGEAGAMLRDMAFVLHLTQKVKKSLIQEAACGVN